MSKPVFALYRRGEGQDLWTADGQPFQTSEEADRHRGRIVGQYRGRTRVAEAMVLEFPSAGDVKMFVPVGKEQAAVPAQASSDVRSVLIEPKQAKVKFGGRADTRGRTAATPAAAAAAPQA